MALGLFLILNGLWIVYYMDFKSYVTNIPIDENGVYSKDIGNGFLCSVNMPSYLRFNGELEVYDEDEDNKLVIWISSLKKEKTYGAMVKCESEQYAMYLNEDGSFIDEENPKEYKDFYIKSKKTIDKLYQSAALVWNLKE